MTDLSGYQLASGLTQQTEKAMLYYKHLQYHVQTIGKGSTKRSFDTLTDARKYFKKVKKSKSRSVIIPISLEP